MNLTQDKSTEIYINSAVDKTNLNDTLSNFTSFLPIPVELTNNIPYGLSVKSASICNTFPQFHETERKFRIGSFEFIVDDDILFSNTTALCVYLTNLCSAQGVDLVFAIDANTQRIRLTNNEATTLTIVLTEPYLTFWKKLGFEYDLQQSLTSIVLTAGDDVLLRHIATLIPTERVYIVCDEVVPNSTYPTNNNRPIICSIPLQAGYGAFNTINENFLYEHDLRFRHSFNSLSFTVLDDKYRELKMRGGSVILSLIVKPV